MAQHFQLIKFFQFSFKAFINVIMMKVETRMWNQLHSDTKGNCEPKRRLVLDHIEFTCGIQMIIVHSLDPSILDMIYGFVKIIVSNWQGKRLCFCSLLHHPQKVDTTGTTTQMRFSPFALCISLHSEVSHIFSFFSLFLIYLFLFFFTWSSTLFF